jgi:hypothetical protein
VAGFLSATSRLIHIAPPEVALFPLNLQPENEIVLRSEKLITFDIKAWKSENDLQPVKCIITLDNIFIDD